VLRIDALAADEGDCLWVEYGTSERRYRILIDGGRSRTYGKLRSKADHLAADERRFELLVVSHIDRDHIEGVLDLLEDPGAPLSFSEIWFNGYHHLYAEDIQTYSPLQGERMSERLRTHPGWNREFNRKGVVLPEQGSVSVPLAGDAHLYLLSPSQAKLNELRGEWQRAIADAGLLPGRAARPEGPEGIEVMSPIDVDTLAASVFKADKSKPNGSSIAFVLEYDGRRILCGGDAHVDLLLERIPALPFFDAQTGRLPIDVFKLPHHGSAKNCSKPLLDLLDCPRYLFSTNVNYFKHPDREAVARVIKFGGDSPTLCFNYRSEETAVWDDARLKRRHGYGTEYANPGQDFSLELA
jgi:beta-lactamase superfamily II metal-dependent hydrolase